MADSAAKTSEHFAGVDPEYAVYTNDVDKPYPVSAEPEKEPEKEPEGDGDDSKTDESETAEPKADGAKTTSRQTKK